MSTWPLLVIALLIVLNALYVAAEFAAVGARVSRVEKYANEGRWLARALLPIVRETKRLDNYIAACQIGITVSSLVLGAFGQATLGLALGNWLDESAGMETVPAFALSAVIVLVVLTSTQVVLGELIPKTVALQFPVRTAMYTYLPMKWSLVVFSPFIRFLNGSGNAVLRLFGASHAGGHHHVHSPEEIEMLLRESTDEGSIAEDEGDRLRAGLRLARRTARQLMVPRRDIVGLDLAQSPDRMLAMVRTSPYTRLVGYRGNLDEVLGFLHVKDLTAHIARGGSLDNIESLLRPLLSIPSELSAERVLEQLREHRARLALVVSAHGEIDGLLTLQDVVSEVLGETADEFKTSTDHQPVVLAAGSWRVNGRMDVEELLDWAVEQGLPRAINDSEAQTVSGLIMHELEVVPSIGDRVRVHGVQLVVERMRGAAVDSAIVSLLTDDGAHGNG